MRQVLLFLWVGHSTLLTVILVVWLSPDVVAQNLQGREPSPTSLTAVTAGSSVEQVLGMDMDFIRHLDFPIRTDTNTDHVSYSLLTNNS